MFPKQLSGTQSVCTMRLEIWRDGQPKRRQPGYIAWEVDDGPSVSW